MPLAAGRRFAELAGRRKRPSPQVTRPDFLPPLQGGINAIAGAATAPRGDALYLYNMIPSEFGVRVRLGYAEYCEPVPLGDGIKTLIPVDPQDGDPKKLFACTSDGIYDVGTAGGTPVKVQDFGSKTVLAGWCVWTNFTNIAGQYVLVCDSANGYFIYDVDADTWSQVAMGVSAGEIDGVDPETFDYVMVWKNRVWFIERGTGTGWYLPVGQITGTVESFEFGNKFKYGGHLKALYNWTLDGGEGIDDYVMALSSAGDMLIYKGSNPEVFGDFIMHGSWFIGQVPAGRQPGEDTGGEMLVLSEYGLIQASKLIAGLPLTDAQASISHKINPRINTVLARSINEHGWQVRQDPKNNLIWVVTPKETGLQYMQFVYQTDTKGWAQFLDLPIKTLEVWDGQLYFGSDDNRIYLYTNNVDAAMLADEGASAVAIDWEQLSCFDAYQTPAIFKRVQMMRPQFLAASVPSYSVAARYDFDTSQLSGAPSFVVPAGGVWGSGLWDVDVWGGGYIVNQPLRGGAGLGRYIAIAIRGRSAADTIHVGTDVLYDTGGTL